MAQKFRYTTDHIAFLEAGYSLMRIARLTRAFNSHFGLNKSTKAIKTALTSRGITCGRKPGFVKGENIRLFTYEQIEFLRENYKRYSLKELLELVNATFSLNITLGQLRTFTKNHSIQSGRTGRFPKGHKSWNSGTKGQGLCRPNSGSFKKGSVPANIKPLGHERICSKDGYILVKIAETNPYTGTPTRYKAKHIVVWEQHNGPIPEGYNIRFFDGNCRNCDIDNLFIISKSENLRLNQSGFNDLPVDLKPSALILAKLEVKSFGLRKKAKQMR